MSSAGQVVGGIVGGIVGFIVGGPAGALKGIYVGATVGSIIDPPKGPTIRGPRLDDLSVQTATYGAFIPRLYGTVAIHGNVFWVQGDKLIEVQKDTDSGGKGGPTQTTETFEYFASFAVGLCEGPIVAVRRIWIAGQLWYDAGANDVASIIVSNENADGFQLYLGSETQNADPLIQADKGAANVPAYRGLAYIVFNRLPLANYNNSLMGAQVKVEVVKTGTITSNIQLISTTSTGGARYPRSVAASGNYLYAANFSGNSLQAFDIGNPSLPVSVGFTPTGTSPLFVTTDDKFLYVVNSGSVSLQEFYLSTGGAPALKSTTTTSAAPSCVAVDGDYIYVTSTGLLEVYRKSALSPPYFVATLALGGAPNFVKVLNGFAYIVNYGSDLLQIVDVSTETPVLVGSVATFNEPYALDVKNGYAYVLINTASKMEVYNVSNPAAPFYVTNLVVGSSPQSIEILGDYAFILNTVELRLKAVNITDPLLPVIAATANTGVVSPYGLTHHRGNLYIGNYGTGAVQAYLFSGEQITGGAAPLSEIVSAECLKSKLLTAADIDVTELTDSVRGYRISSLGAIRAGLDPVRAAWPFDVVQSGYKIKFKKRGGASVATITAGELDAHAAGDAPGVSITDSREMDLILPYKVGVKYLDTTREYDTNEQYAERLNTDAVNESSIDMPIVFTASEAAGKAETLLYMYWLERYDVAFKLPPAYAHLEPGDVITISATHATYSLRLTSVNHAPDGRLECQAKYNSASIYTPAAQGSEGASVAGVLTLAGPTAYQLLDIPMLRDADNVPGFAAAMTGYLAGWPGGVLFRSEDGGETWADIVGAVSPGAVMGYATTTLSAHGGTVYDFTSTLAVRLYQGTLSSVTEAQLFAAQNWFAYGADGRWEIIAARTATLQGDGSYILRDFLRGQLGTEWATGLHVNNDSIVRLNAATLDFINVNASTIGSERHYRGITAGKALDSDSNRAFTYRGVNLECLSPVHATGNRHPTSNDWTLTWVRRSRFSGWRDLVDATLGETTESYEVDIFSSNTYLTLKRTLTSATPTVAYTSANQVTDFGANQATLYLKIYQISSIVGRGYPLTISLTR